MLLLAVLAIVTGSAAQNVTLRVGLLPGTRESGAPYVFTTADGTLTGYFVQFLQSACTNCSIEWITLEAGIFTTRWALIQDWGPLQRFR